MKEKKAIPLKTVKIVHRGHVVVIETDHSKIDSVRFILATLFYELQRLRPDRLDHLMQGFQLFYNRALREVAVKNEGRKLPEVDELDPVTFEEWAKLLETPPPGVGEGRIRYV